MFPPACPSLTPGQSFKSGSLQEKEKDVSRPELRLIVNFLIGVFGQKAKKRGSSFLGLLGGESYHAWDVFETYAQEERDERTDRGETPE